MTSPIPVPESEFTEAIGTARADVTLSDFEDGLRLEAILRLSAQNETA